MAYRHSSHQGYQHYKNQDKSANCYPIFSTRNIGSQISVLNVTCYAAQINCQNINILMDKVAMTSHDINNLYNLTISLVTSVSFPQLVLLM